MSGHSDRCFGTPAGATTLLLRGQARPDRCFDTLVGVTALLLRGKACPDRCFDTHSGAMTLMLVLWHSCCVGMHVLIGASALLLCATIPQYYIVPSGTYCAASYSFLMIGLVVK